MMKCPLCGYETDSGVEMRMHFAGPLCRGMMPYHKANYFLDTIGGYVPIPQIIYDYLGKEGCRQFIAFKFKCMPLVAAGEKILININDFIDHSKDDEIRCPECLMILPPLDLWESDIKVCVNGHEVQKVNALSHDEYVKVMKNDR